MHRVEFTCEVPQRAYWEAAGEYNSDIQHRSCPACGQVHDPAQFGDIAWNAVADALDLGRTG